MYWRTESYSSKSLEESSSDVVAVTKFAGKVLIDTSYSRGRLKGEHGFRPILRTTTADPA
jgi:hypothetical protein